MVMRLRVEIHPEILLGSGFVLYNPPPLHFAAEEAWMSINTLHWTTAMLRIWMKLRGYVLAVVCERGR